MDAIKFFRELYGSADGWLSLWRRDKKTTRFVSSQDHNAIGSFVDAANETPFDAYFGVCLQTEKPTKGRGNESGVGVMPAIWVDIDFAFKDQSEKKSSKTYPTREQAELAIEAMPVPPSIVFFTGGGIHAYWILTTPVVVTDENRVDVKSVVQKWQSKMRAFLLKSCGATVDSTHDLARVMRIPGTVNVKTSETIPVVVDEQFAVADPLTRYSLDELRTEAPATPSKAANRPASSSAERIPDRVLGTVESNPPADRLDNLIEADNKFAASWRNQRRDLQSPSEYDLSLATFAHHAGWSDNEIAALMIAFTRRFYPDRIDKLLRVSNGCQDYLEMTIRQAKRKTFESAQMVESREAIDRVIDLVDTSAERGEPASRDQVFEYVSLILGVRVVGFRQTGERDEVYELIVIHEGKPKPIEIGGADKIHNTPNRLVQRLLASTRTYVQITSDLRKKWGGIVRALFSVVEFVEVVESTTAERVRALLNEHLARHRGPMKVANVEQRQQAAVESRPFIENRLLYVSGPSLRRLAGEIDRGIVGDLYVGLRSLGFSPKTIQIPLQTTSRSCWAVDASSFGLAASEAPDLSDP